MLKNSHPAVTRCAVTVPSAAPHSTRPYNPSARYDQINARILLSKTTCSKQRRSCQTTGREVRGQTDLTKGCAPNGTKGAKDLELGTSAQRADLGPNRLTLLFWFTMTEFDLPRRPPVSDCSEGGLRSECFLNTLARADPSGDGR
jgi:hypothetical protein